MAEISRCGSMFVRGSGKDVCRRCYCSEDPLIVSDLVYVDDAPKVRVADPSLSRVVMIKAYLGGIIPQRWRKSY